MFAVMIILVVYSCIKGNLKDLIAPVDGDLKMCGASPGYEDFKYLYITKLEDKSIKEIFSTGVCVHECPDAANRLINCHTTPNVTSCNEAPRYKTTTIL